MKIFFVSLLLISFSSFSETAFQLKNAPITDLTSWVSDATGKSVIVSQSASQTLVTAHIPKLSNMDVILLLEQICKSNNLIVLNYGDYIRVESDENQIVTVGALQSRVYSFTHIQNDKLLPLFKQAIETPESDKKFMEKVDDVKFQIPSVTPLPNSNSLLVITTPEAHENLANLRGALDKNIRQVLIEAVIMETDAGDGSSIGIDLSTALKNTGFTLTSNLLGALTSTQTLTGGSAVYSSGGDLRAVINAISTEKHTKILSTPTLLVMDRERGAISVGQNVPFLIAQDTTDGGRVSTRIERQNVGVSLSVIPHVLENGSVILKINQESSSVTDSTFASDIITNQRSIQTTVSVSNGQTIVLGGLVSEESRKSQKGVPVLKDVPFIGSLFKTETINKVQRELTVMIKVQLF
ncbi:hypothetical protein [Pseudoalteromonas sp. KAN5]|uniref:hypothetical protein n=1 Tax=Pseudoalteromonas sp. KAN5 TaxID=2916633 RepID=UPI001FCAABAF|nr:hypothetical protein [Pseudoalteromonas sp. KAN5]BDF93653.1 hypothetical protein KAN5_04910 [Pseudoalteromonas sp. KAN5]